VRAGQADDAGPDGAPSLPKDPSRPLAFYLASGYLPLGPRAVRIDRAEHAAAVASRLSQKGPFTPPRDLPVREACGFKGNVPVPSPP
jgi:hypothetical protein